MSYISLIAAFFKTNGSDLTGLAWWNLYFDNLVQVKEVFFDWIWVIALVLGLSFTVVFLLSGLKFSLGLLVISLYLPLLDWITLWLAHNMAATIDPTKVFDLGSLIVSLIIYLLIGFA